MIGKQYLFTALFMGLFAVAWSIMIRIQMAWPKEVHPYLGRLFPGLYESGVLLPERYLSLVTMHGSLMVFFVISLALVSGFGNFIIPLLPTAPPRLDGPRIRRFRRCRTRCRDREWDRHSGCCPWRCSLRPSPWAGSTTSPPF
jgi:heme/copper-type cytochrome/quinol oxidase subunit 1